MPTWSKKTYKAVAVAEDNVCHSKTMQQDSCNKLAYLDDSNCDCKKDL